MNLTSASHVAAETSSTCEGKRAGVMNDTSELPWYSFACLTTWGPMAVLWAKIQRAPWVPGWLSQHGF